MAVDPSGGIYVTPLTLSGDTSISVVKLGATGIGIAWRQPVGFLLPFPNLPALAADPAGRAYVAGFLGFDDMNNQSVVVRLDAAGSAVDYTAHVTGWATSIAASASGTAFVAGYASGTAIFLAGLAPDGSAGFYSTIPYIGAAPTVALDASGDAVISTTY
jgi:hypothetical protein